MRIYLSGKAIKIDPVFIAFYDFIYFVSVVSHLFISSVWDAHDGDHQFPLLVNTTSRSQWNAALYILCINKK